MNDNHQSKNSSNTEDSRKAYEIDLCGAEEGCPLALFDVIPLSKKIDTLVKEEGWPDFFYEQHRGGEILFHSRLRISISACPNACSNPHIKDIGIIGQNSPVLVSELCKECKKCQKICQEDAITMKKGYGPVFDTEKCMSCGQCIAICPFDALKVDKSGHQILVGGKLGRHPQCGSVVKNYASDEELLAIIKKSIELIKEKSPKKGVVRLGEVITPEIEEEMKKVTF